MSVEFLITALVVVLIPGTGVIYTVSTALFRGAKSGCVAAIGCTLGITPHLLASILGLASLMHASAVAFSFVKYAGVIYLLYLAYGMWQNRGALSLAEDKVQDRALKTALQGVMINILNPKLTIFFLAFLPQFVSTNSETVAFDMLNLSLVFMGLTFIVFVLYAFAAHGVRQYVLGNERFMRLLQRSFAAVFVGLSAKLAFEK